MEFNVREVDPVLNVQGVCDAFKTSKSTVYREIKNGMPYITVGQEKRFVFSEVLHWFKTKK